MGGLTLDTPRYAVKFFFARVPNYPIFMVIPRVRLVAACVNRNPRYPADLVEDGEEIEWLAKKIGAGFLLQTQHQ